MIALIAIFAIWTLFVAVVVAVEVEDRCLTKQSHGDRPDADGVVGDLPFIPNELKSVFHLRGDK